MHVFLLLPTFHRFDQFRFKFKDTRVFPRAVLNFGRTKLFEYVGCNTVGQINVVVLTVVFGNLFSRFRIVEQVPTILSFLLYVETKLYLESNAAPVKVF